MACCFKKGRTVMLEAKELFKVYKPKKGVAVTALNRISLKFPEKGMVFLLGKSGSGKSTLLNLLGGLDKYDDGEIIIKGVSSKDFNQQHFDSYRNTYVGFIFQEYNVLEEFSVGANIALALELQGKKATDEEINSILQEVDLEGYGNRKPNELSGGQKQRVAIARALVKNPKIIMADEPTGALDSNTGKQVFDTLKKLSKDKLVIIVSHDREFSELYADRIIELSDGNVISDVEIDPNETNAEEEVAAKNLDFQGNTIELAAGYQLTEEDRIAINEYIKRITDQNLKLRLTEGGRAVKKFVETNQEAIPTPDSSTFQLIKSKLPMGNAIKIGASGLKYKKFRLVLTILLSCVAFGLFGLSDTFSAYNHVETCTNSLMDSGVDYVSMEKSVKSSYGFYNSFNTTFSEKELEDIAKGTGVHLSGIFVPLNSELDFYDYYSPDAKFSETDYDIYTDSFNGMVEVTSDILKEYGYELVAGTLPDGNKPEMAVSKYVFQSFQIGGYQNKADGTDLVAIKNYEDLLGKTLEIEGQEYTITGIVDTHLELERYQSLTEKSDEPLSTAKQLANYALMNEFVYAKYYSLATTMMLGEGSLKPLIEKEPNISPITTRDIYFYNWAVEENEEMDFSLNPLYLAKLSDISDNMILWTEEPKETLGEKEIIVSTDMISDFLDNFSQDTEKARKQLKKVNFEMQLSPENWGATEEWITEDGYRIVGILNIEDNPKYWNTIIMDDSNFNRCIKEPKGTYSYLIGPMPSSKKEVKKIVSFCYSKDNDTQYPIKNAVTYELDTINEILKESAKIFLYIGIGFAIFAAIMLANFIGTSISYKKQEIGILRAIGSRSNDVFRIFFSESFIIAMINFVLSTTGLFIVVAFMNSTFRSELGILITLLNVGIRQILLLFLVSVAVAFVASFIPVKRIAAKRPIDAIRNR